MHIYNSSNRPIFLLDTLFDLERVTQLRSVTTVQINKVEILYSLILLRII